MLLNSELVFTEETGVKNYFYKSSLANAKVFRFSCFWYVKEVKGQVGESRTVCEETHTHISWKHLSSSLKRSFGAPGEALGKGRLWQLQIQPG